MSILETPEQPKNKIRKQEEGVIQVKCFTWLWNNYPETRGLFFAVVNELEGNIPYNIRKKLGANRKARGVVSGVSDSILLIPRGHYHGACVEAKKGNGYQSPEQKEWQKKVEAQGYKYILYHSEEEFKKEIIEYLQLKKGSI